LADHIYGTAVPYHGTDHISIFWLMLAI